jgi:hypothetical protein
MEILYGLVVLAVVLTINYDTNMQEVELLVILGNLFKYIIKYTGQSYTRLQ